MASNYSVVSCLVSAAASKVPHNFCFERKIILNLKEMKKAIIILSGAIVVIAVLGVTDILGFSWILNQW